MLTTRFPLPDEGIQRDQVPTVIVYTTNYCSVVLGNMIVGVQGKA